MRTITTREQLLVNGKVRERIATHIVTGAHGYETLCTSGYNLQYNKERVLIENCERWLMENCLSPATPVSLYGRMYTGSNLVTLTQNQEREISLIRSSRKSQLDENQKKDNSRMKRRVDIL